MGKIIFVNPYKDLDNSYIDNKEIFIQEKMKEILKLKAIKTKKIHGCSHVNGDGDYIIATKLSGTELFDSLDYMLTIYIVSANLIEQFDDSEKVEQFVINSNCYPLLDIPRMNTDDVTQLGLMQPIYMIKYSFDDKKLFDEFVIWAKITFNSDKLHFDKIID